MSHKETEDAILWLWNESCKPALGTVDLAENTTHYESRPKTRPSFPLMCHRQKR